MEVLKHGKYYNKNKDTIKCGCGCKFKYTEEDITRVRDSVSMLEKATFVKCPECEKAYRIGLGGI